MLEQPIFQDSKELKGGPAEEIDEKKQ